MNYEIGTHVFVKRTWTIADGIIIESGEEVLEVEIVANGYDVKDLMTGKIYKGAPGRYFFSTREAAQNSPTATNPEHQ
jgi:hypothetical protein